MQNFFHALTEYAQTRLQGDEQFTCWFAGESGDFVRFNRGAIRQPGHVEQRYLLFSLIDGARHAQSSISLCGNEQTDYATIARTITVLRDCLEDLPDDPHLLVNTEVRSSERILASRLPPTVDIVDEVLAAAQGFDFVGILAAGGIYRGFANSLGQKNWHETANFNLDWSLYHAQDKAVKTAYAGFDWEPPQFCVKFEHAANRLALLQRPAITVPPGSYRSYLAPSAMQEIIGMLNWGGLSEKALRTRQSPLRRMRDEDIRLHHAIILKENTVDGLSPNFQEDGFLKPAQIDLIDQGRLAGTLVSPRTAKEYGISTNGANNSESASSIDLAAGDIPQSQILKELDTGIFISNLWYLNFSDRANCRVTGMTRFASFWVERGQIVAPLNVMRFDDSLLQLLGPKLIGLTQERELLVDADAYGQRGTSSARLPGALVKDFNFVL